MRIGHLLLTGLAVLCVVGADASAGKVEDLLKDAQEERDKGRVGQAAPLFARAVAEAQKKGDLVVEMSAARGLSSLFERGGGSIGRTGGAIMTSSGGSSSRLTDDQRELLALALGGLAAKQHGALVAPMTIARQILYAATERADTEHCSAAASALRDAAKSKGAGRAAAVMLQYAEGLTLRESDTAKAAQQFDAAYVVAAEEGWHDLTTHIGTERAGLLYDAKDIAGAEKILEDVAAVLGDEVALRTASAWTRAVEARLPDAPASTKAILTRATRNPRPLRPVPVISDSGFGRAKSTQLGRALKKGGKKKTLVTVRRTSNGMEVICHFDPKSEQMVLPSADEQRVDLDGLVVIVRGHHVSVFDVQAEREASKGIGNIAAGMTRGGIGSIVRAEYLLGQDETWTLTKGAGVSISLK